VKWLVLVVLDVHLEMVQQPAAVLGDAEEMDPGAVGAGGPPRGGSCRPTATALNRSRAQRLCLLGGAPGPVAAHAGRGTACRGAGGRAGRGPSRARVRARGSRPSSTTRIVFSSGARYRPASGSHGGVQPGQVCLAGPPDPLPDGGEPVVPGRGETRRPRSRPGRPAGRSALAASAGQAASPAAATRPRPDRRHRDQTRPPAPPRATMTQRARPHLVHVDLRDLHDHRGVPVPTTRQLHSTPRISGITDKPGTRRSPGAAPRGSHCASSADTGRRRT